MKYFQIFLIAAQAYVASVKLFFKTLFKRERQERGWGKGKLAKANNLLNNIVSLLLIVMIGVFVANVFSPMYGAAVGVLFLASGIIDMRLPRGALYLNAINIIRNRNKSKMSGCADYFYYALREDILTYPVALQADFATAATPGALVTIPANDNFVMKPGKFFHRAPVSVEGGKINSKLVGPMGSKSFEQEYSGEDNANNDDYLGLIPYVSNDGVILLVPELNGNRKVVGTELYPAMLDTAETNNGGKVSDGNVLKFSFKAASATPCPNYLGDLTPLLDPGVAAPSVYAGPDQTLASGATTATFAGTATTASGTITSKGWSLISGPNTPTITTPTALASGITGLIPGVYVFELVATNSSLQVAADRVVITAVA